MTAPSNHLTLGYEFHPDCVHGALGYGRLDVVLCTKPTGLHFDPTQVHLCLVAPNGHPQETTIHHPAYLGADSAQVLAGRIILRDHVGKTVEAFSFGGRIAIKVEPERTLCHITSSAPIIELSPDESLPTLLVEEVEVLLAHHRARLDQQGKDYDLGSV